MDETCTWTKDPDGYWATDCGEAFEIADRLDRYRDLIKRLSYSLPATEVFRYLHRDIREALK